jgi:hypothetical protein
MLQQHQQHRTAVDNKRCLCQPLLLHPWLCCWQGSIGGPRWVPNRGRCYRLRCCQWRA